MFALLHSLTKFVIDFFKSPRRLEAENLFLRHQLSIALRRAPPRLRLRGSDRALLVWALAEPAECGCLGCTTITFGYDFRKAQVARGLAVQAESGLSAEQIVS